MKKFRLWIVLSILLLASLACQFTPQVNVGLIPTILAPLQLTGQPGTTLSPTRPIQEATRAPLFSTGNYNVNDEQLVKVFKNVNGGIVAIQTLTADGGGLGSGFVYDKQGHIITNYHVVEGATDLEVDFPSGYKVRGKVLATDLDSDIAVIKVDAPASELFPLTMGDSDLVQVGQTVIAIGNPFGYTSTMTSGIISAKGRTMESMRQTSSGSYFSTGDVIQTDASINPGNSGGPLIDLNGAVIGVNRSIITSSTTATGEPVNSGIGFAVSINMVKKVVPVLIKNGKYDYPYLGMTAREELSLIELEALGITRTTGAYVASVVTGGPADKAGLKGGTRQVANFSGLLAGGDLMIAVDNRPIRVFGDMLSYLMSNKSPGDKIVIKILRDNQEKEVTVTLGKRP